METEIFNQELTKKMNSLQAELGICKRQKEVISIIKSLKSIGNLSTGYNVVMDGLKISSEGITDFISLLDSSEYLKGYSSGGNDIFGAYPKKHKYDVYYLTLCPSIVLELKFRETEIMEHTKPIKESDLTILAFADLQDLSIKVDEHTYGWPRIEILRQNGNGVFNSNTTHEYLRFNNQKLGEALVPISVDDLANRFFDVLQNQEEKGIQK